jgi:hypothetical protein
MMDRVQKPSNSEFYTQLSEPVGILKFILDREDGIIKAGLIWLRIGTSGGLLQTW